jgi:hypothetical protein
VGGKRGSSKFKQANPKPFSEKSAPCGYIIIELFAPECDSVEDFSLKFWV